MGWWLSVFKCGGIELIGVNAELLVAFVILAASYGPTVDGVDTEKRMI